MKTYRYSVRKVEIENCNWVLNNPNPTQSQIEKHTEKKKSMLQEKAEELWPKMDSKYWFIDDDGEIDWGFWYSDGIDKFRLKNHNVFKSEAKAEKKLEEIIEGNG